MKMVRTLEIILTISTLFLLPIMVAPKDLWASPQTELSAEHSRCMKDSDCTLLSIECSCDCGQPLNIRFLGEYLTAKMDRCKNYSGKKCRMKCPDSEALACIGDRCVIRDSLVSYESEVPYRLNEPIRYPDITITFKGVLLESGHEKISSQTFEIAQGSEIKHVTVPLLSMGGTLVRFGFSFYRLHVRVGYKTLVVEKGW